jgi:hypothetical protein
VQSKASRTAPDVVLVADPAPGAWIADACNLDPSKPFAVVMGTARSSVAGVWFACKKPLTGTRRDHPENGTFFPGRGIP